MRARRWPHSTGSSDTTLSAASRKRSSSTWWPAATPWSSCRPVAASPCATRSRPWSDRRTGIVVSPLIALMQDQVDALRALGVRAGFMNSTQDFDERRVVEAEFLAGELDLLYLAPERLRLDSTLRPARPRQDRAVRHRRGALRVPVGPRLPPRLPRPLRTRRALARRPADRAHGHGHARHAPGDHPAAPHADGPALRGELRPAQHPVPDRAQGRPQEAAAELPARGGRRGRGHRLLPVPQSRWRRRRSSSAATASRRCRITRAWTRARARRTSPGSCARRAWSWWRPSPSGWASTSRTCGSSPTWTCRSRSRATTRRPGRAGRDGLPSTAWMAYGLNDVIQQRKLIQLARATRRSGAGPAPTWTRCWRCARPSSAAGPAARLLRPGPAPTGCGNCDTCLTPPETWDGTVAAQKVLSTVVRLQRERGQKFGASQIDRHPARQAHGQGDPVRPRPAVRVRHGRGTARGANGGVWCGSCWRRDCSPSRGSTARWC